MNLVPKIRELTAKAVPGLSYDQVSVMLVPMRESVGVPMQPQSSFLGLTYFTENGPPYLLIGACALFLLAVIALITFAVLNFLKHRGSKTADSNEKTK